MSTMLVELYNALKEAGASELKARTAAESVLLGCHRLSRIEEHTGRMPKIGDDIARLADELNVLEIRIGPLMWMNSIVIAGVLALIIKTFFA